jgi:hypothetical protein
MPIPEKAFTEGKVEKQPKLTKDAADIFRRRSLHRCILCRDPNRTEYEEQYFGREIAQKDIALKLHCSEEQVSEHFRFHIPNQVAEIVASKSVTDLAELVVDKLGLLKKHSLKLDSMLETLYKTGEYDPATINSIKALVSELRNYIKDMALLEGELRAAPIFQLQQMNIQFNQLKQTILTKLPPEYQSVVVKALEELEHTPT